MNKHIFTSFVVENTPDARRESVIATAFASLLPILAAYIRAERDLEDVGFSLDPAYAQWHHDSEAAQDRLIDVLHVLRTAPLGIAMDAPLRRMALLIHAMRDDPEHARNLCQKMEAESPRVSGCRVAAQWRTIGTCCSPGVGRLSQTSPACLCSIPIPGKTTAAGWLHRSDLVSHDRLWRDAFPA